MLDRYLGQVRLLVDVLPDVATLDRQHSHDLFDVGLLHARITDHLFRAFRVYVASSRWPTHELLATAFQATTARVGSWRMSSDARFVSMANKSAAQ